MKAISVNGDFDPDRGCDQLHAEVASSAEIARPPGAWLNLAAHIGDRMVPAIWHHWRLDCQP